MKKKWIGVVTSTLCALSLLAAPVTAWAGQATWIGSAPDSNPTTAGSIITETGDTSMSVDVNASVENAGDKIRYSVDVEYGDMQFVYDYGYVWDPVTHTYETGNSGLIKGGWVTNYIDGKNNAIRIVNNSNYPVTATLSYEALNAPNSTAATFFNGNPKANQAVTGIFGTDNDEFAKNINTADYKGVNATKVTTKTDFSADLDWDYSNLTDGEYVNYGRLPNSNNGYQKSELEVYFTLCGVPDEKCYMATQAGLNGGNSNMSKVGTIKLEIKPSANATTTP